MCISYEARTRYEEYYHQKFALECRNVCDTPAYLATLLHSNNTKDVEELVAYIQKKNVVKVLGVRISSLHRRRMFSFSMPLSAEVGVTNRTQCCQRLATAATFLLCCPGANPRR